jgi:hypothetical protein
MSGRDMLVAGTTDRVMLLMNILRQVAAKGGRFGRHFFLALSVSFTRLCGLLDS